MLLVPVLTAVFGPLVAGPTRSVGDSLSPPGPGHPLGTDELGRDVLALVLRGGTSIVSMAGAALLLSYLVGVPLALLVAGGRRRWADRLVLRLLDFLLALPGLLVLLVLAATGWRGTTTLVLATAALQLPAVVRIARAAALAPETSTAMEAMTMQGESRARIRLGYLGRSVLGPVVVDAASRLNLVLYLMASANFLGLGLASSATDWAVLIELNRDALFIQPWAVTVPALMLVSLCTGVNLVVDRRLSERGTVRR
ncbi:ABC transporter permease [Actinopolyspora erythraea]|uniref:ABC transporter permease n=1 Tax=Actinopolyspora erythraea TaxID=414996 RepID=A0A223RYA9_9ACTN|nr:ABC transporter permease [Actinopolyspora erythraea]